MNLRVFAQQKIPEQTSAFVSVSHRFACFLPPAPPCREDLEFSLSNTTFHVSVNKLLLYGPLLQSGSVWSYLRNPKEEKLHSWVAVTDFCLYSAPDFTFICRNIKKNLAKASRHDASNQPKRVAEGRWTLKEEASGVPTCAVKQPSLSSFTFAEVTLQVGAHLSNDGSLSAGRWSESRQPGRTFPPLGFLVLVHVHLHLQTVKQLNLLMALSQSSSCFALQQNAKLWFKLL